METTYLFATSIVVITAIVTAGIWTAFFLEHKVEDCVHREHDMTRHALEDLYRQVAPNVADQIRDRQP